MSPLIQSDLMGAVFTTAIAVSVILRGDKTRRQILFLFLTISVAVYYTLAFVCIWLRLEVLLRLLMAAALVLPHTLIEFFRAFTGDAGAGRRRSRFRIFMGVSTLLTAIVALPPLLPLFLSGFVVMGYVAVMLYVCIYYLHTKTRGVGGRAEARIEATRVSYLVIGGLIAVTFSFTDYLIEAGVPFLPIGPLLVSIYLYLLAQALFSHRLMDLYELLGRMAILCALSLALAGIFSVLTLFEMASTSFFVNAMAAAFVMLIVFDPLREKVEQRIGEFFLKERSDFVNSIEDTRREIGRAFEIEGIATTLMEGLKRSGRLTNACFYAIDEIGERFLRKGAIGQPPPDELNVAAVRPLVDTMEREGFIVAEAVRKRWRALRLAEGGGEGKEGEGGGGAHREARAREAALLESVATTMEELRSDVVLPVKERETTYGFLGIRDERLRDPFSAEDLKLLGALVGHAAVAVENTRLYEKIKERDRLAAIGEMSAGLAHEIRNPLGAIKGAVQYITGDGAGAAGGGRGEAEREFLDIIISEVDRLNKVVTSFLDYARPSHTRDEKGVAEVNAVVAQTKKAIEREHSSEGVTVEVDVEERSPRVHLSEEKLGQVLWNLLINAIDAAADAGGPGRVVVQCRKVHIPPPLNPALPYAGSASGMDFVQVSVTDNGRGIPPAVLPKIFIPFFTTKQRGTGLGLAISHRIIREAGGFIEIDTKAGEGTTFRILLPAI